jgi:putative DNA primase/helicase
MKPEAELLVQIEALNLSAIPQDSSEDALARAFAEKHKNDLRFDHTMDKWLHWDGSRWKIENTKLAFHWARELCRQVNRNNPDKALPKVRTASAVETFCRADRRFAVTHELWDTDPWLLCTPDGTVELRTGEIRENRPKDHITRCTTVSPRQMPMPLFQQFLDEVTKGDKDLQQFLQTLFGYSLTGVTWEHILIFIYGLGGNGKGTLVNAVHSIMGDYATAAPMETFTASKYDRHPTELAGLAGARMVTASETEEGRAWAESRIKQLTGGDPIKARFMRKDFFEYLPQFKLVFLGNHKPVLRNVDDAARRRFHVIPFPYKPTRPDPELPEKLKAEYPGILQWCIEGCLQWQQHGLVVPEVVRKETEEYFASQDIFTQWLNECTEQKYETTGEPSARLFANWKEWAHAQGEDPGTSIKFTERLERAGYRKVKDTPGNRGKRGFIGIALKVEARDWHDR